MTPIIKGRYADLDFARIVDFFRYNKINKIDISSWKDTEIKRFLKNKEVLVEYQGKLCPTVAGALLFVKKPSYLHGYSGITVTKFAATERDYNYADFRLDKPIMNTFSEHGEKEKFGLIDEALEKIKSIILEKSSAALKGAVRVVDYPYPEESIREAIVNAVAHRDYTISGIDIRVDIYPDRLEIESPGKLPNTLSLESIRLGAKYYRNQILVQYLKEAGFMDLHSLGIPVKILKLCAEYTGREPDLDESDNSFKVTLYPKKKAVVGEVEECILNLLRTSGKPMKTREIGAAMGLAKRTTINLINRLIEKNMVEPTSEKRNDPNCAYRIRY